LTDERDLLADGVDAKHLKTWFHDGKHGTRQAAPAADIQKALARQSANGAAERLDDGKTIDQMEREHLPGLIQRGEVVHAVPALQQSQEVEQLPLHLRRDCQAKVDASNGKG
jgi:hypothetical protein